MGNEFFTPAEIPEKWDVNFKKILTDIINRSVEGYDNPLENLIILRELAANIDNAISKIMPNCLSEIAKYNDSKAEINGKILSVTSSGRYDYSEVPSILKLETESKRLQKLAQAAYKLKQEIADSETGEMIQPANYLPSKSSIKIN